MKLLPALASLLFAMPVAAQEYPGNWWINPATGQAESLEGGRAEPVAQQDSGEWFVLAYLTGNRELMVRENGIRRYRKPDGSEGRSVFSARIVRNGRSQGTTLYTAWCAEETLFSHKIGEISTLPGTMGEALYNWACLER